MTLSCFVFLQDLSAEFMPAVQIGYFPEKYGYPALQKWDIFERDVVLKHLQEEFTRNELPRFMKYVTYMIKESGFNFLVGPNITIADLAMMPTVKFFKSGTAKHIPSNCLDCYPEIHLWLERVLNHPKIAVYYS